MVILRWLAMSVVIFLLAATLVWGGLVFFSPDMNLDLAFSIIFYSAIGVTGATLFFFRKVKLLGRNSK